MHQKGAKRTIGSLNKLFSDYCNSNAEKRDAKTYGNVVHPPIVTGFDESTDVLSVIPPPELHLLIGPVNTLYNELSRIWDGSESWIKACNVKRTEYHGGSFAGNDSRMLLKNVAKLKNLCPEYCTPFVQAFEAFNSVVSSCYGKTLLPDYVTNLEYFKEKYLALSINVTPKIHAVMYHVEEFCSQTGMGLGPWSEQTSEALHHDFNRMWENFKIKDMDHPSYSTNLLRAVSMYNSQHL